MGEFFNDYLLLINKKYKTIDTNEVNVLPISYGKSINSSITIKMMKLTMYPTNTLLNKCFKSSFNFLSLKMVASRWIIQG
jgi:hypothetical protein